VGESPQVRGVWRGGLRDQDGVLFPQAESILKKTLQFGTLLSLGEKLRKGMMGAPMDSDQSQGSEPL